MSFCVGLVKFSILIFAHYSEQLYQSRLRQSFPSILCLISVMTSNDSPTTYMLVVLTLAALV